MNPSFYCFLNKLFPFASVWCCLLLIPVSTMGQHYTGQGDLPDKATISVSGGAMIQVQPDRAILSLGIETIGDEIEESIGDNKQIVQKTISALTGQGIGREYIKTDHLSVEPRWANHGSRERFYGHFSRNTLVVTVTDIDALDEILIAAIEAGVTHVHGIDFQTSELRKYRDKARALALEAAREKADDMAAVLGQEVDSPFRITENRVRNWFFGWSHWSRSRSGQMAQNVVSHVPTEDPSTAETVSPGQIAVEGQVQVTFLLRDKDS